MNIDRWPLFGGAIALLFLSATKSLGGKETPSAIYFGIGIALMSFAMAMKDRP